MRPTQLIRLAFRNLQRSAVRSVLTALGIIIGTGSVVAVMGIGNGAKAKVEELLTHVDSVRMYLSASPPLRLWRLGQAPKLAPGAGLTWEDYLAIRSQLKFVVGTTPQMNATSSTPTANGRRPEAQVVGLDVDGLSMFERRVIAGSNFGRLDVERTAAVCLITEALATNLFGSTDAVSRHVRIGESMFRIVGVVADDARYANAARPEVGDSEVFIPYSTLIMRLERNAEFMIVIRAADPAYLGSIRAQLNEIMESRRGTRTALFTVGNTAEALQAYSQGSRTMALLLGAVAGISLIVGGIGIMNIMLVNVAQRTREIGIRVAVGTHARDVLRQFLIEAVTLSGAGGAIGILVGIAALFAFARANDWPVLVTPGALLLAALCSAGVGVFFGYYPAREASRLEPITALRVD